jgi:hypothetical protein
MAGRALDVSEQEAGSEAEYPQEALIELCDEAVAWLNSGQGECPTCKGTGKVAPYSDVAVSALRRSRFDNAQPMAPWTVEVEAACQSLRPKAPKEDDQ